MSLGTDAVSLGPGAPPLAAAVVSAGDTQGNRIKT